MSDTTRPPPRGLLARGMKLIGRLTSEETRTGKVFGRVERRLTKVTARIAESPTWLRVSGGLLRQGFNLRIRRHALLERALHALRLPASSEVELMRDQLVRLGDRVEALGSQLELVVGLLERQQAKASHLAPSLEAPAAREPVAHRRRA